MFQVLLMKGWWLLQAVCMILSHPFLQVQLSQQVEENLQTDLVILHTCCIWIPIERRWLRQPFGKLKVQLLLHEASFQVEWKVLTKYPLLRTICSHQCKKGLSQVQEWKISQHPLHKPEKCQARCPNVIVQDMLCRWMANPPSTSHK
jgi:hypothetical protein